MEDSILGLAGLEEGELSHRDEGSTGASPEVGSDLSQSAGEDGAGQRGDRQREGMDGSS